MSEYTALARQIVTVSHRLYERGHVTATDGNVSTRLPNGNILSTPTGWNKGSVTETDLVELRLDGTPVSTHREPSSEIGMHLFIYRSRPDVHAVVHAHPTYATGFAAAGIPMSEPVFPEVIVGLGSIPLAPFAIPSTPEMAHSIAPFVQNSSAILLANHGVVTYGRNLEDAYFKMEKVEHAAHMLFVARMLGGPKVLTEQQVARLLATFQKPSSS